MPTPQVLWATTLANAIADIYTVPGGKAMHLCAATFVNIDTSNSHTVNLLVRLSGGGTDYNLIGVSVTLPPGSSYLFPETAAGWKAETGTKLRAFADAASVIHCVGSGGLE